MNLQEGRLLQGGRYKIVRFIGQGGFGCTYEAEHVLLEKRVAVKEFFVKDFCNRDATTAHVTVGTTSKRGIVEKLRRKFVDEARAIAQMNHRNIVKVQDIFEENGTAYYVMDYIDGASLNDILHREGSLPPVRAEHYIRQVAEALRYVHSHNRLHLDIKPNNIIIDGDDNAILIDFGASKQYDEADGENTSTLMGKTPGYAPLEQMGNDVVQFLPATDIYALGATYYKLLTGLTPPASNLRAAGDDSVMLPTITRPRVVAAITAAMQIRKDRRPQTIDEFLALLDGDGTSPSTPSSDSSNDGGNEITVLDNHPTPPAPPTPPRGGKGGNDEKRWKTIAVVVGILCAAVVVVCGLLLPGPESETTTSTDSDTIAVEEVEDTIPTYVEDAPKTFRGTTFTYTGPVNAEGLPDGKGKGIYADGTYEGEYVAGCREGQAHYVTTSGNQCFDGTYKDDKYHEGTLTILAGEGKGEHYTGTFKNNKIDTGTWYNANGTQDKFVNGQYR